MSETPASPSTESDPPVPSSSPSSSPPQIRTPTDDKAEAVALALRRDEKKEDVDETQTETPSTTTTASPQFTLPSEREAFYASEEKKVIKAQTAVRRRLAQQSLAKLRKQAEHRAKVVRELLDTEEVYVKNLETVVRAFITPLRKAIVDQKPIVSAKELRNIFSEIEVIVNVNSRLLTTLTPRVNGWTQTERIGDIFLKMTGFLKVYTQFVKDYNSAVTTIRTCSTRPEFKAFLQQAAADPGVGKTQLSSFMILPVQRIPRYEMLLRDLLKHTAPDHGDYLDLSKALDLIKNTARYVDEKKSEAEAVSKVTEVQQTLTGKFPNLAEPHRRFIRQDDLHVLNEKKDRRFILFNDMLLLSKPLKTGQFEFIKSYSVKDIACRDPSEDATIFEFVIKDKDGVFVTRVRSQDPAGGTDVKVAWAKDLGRVKTEWNRSRNTFDATQLEVHGKVLQEQLAKSAVLPGWDINAEEPTDPPTTQRTGRGSKIFGRGSKTADHPSPAAAASAATSPAAASSASTEDKELPSEIVLPSIGEKEKKDGFGKKLRNFFSFRIRKPADASVKNRRELTARTFVPEPEATPSPPSSPGLSSSGGGTLRKKKPIPARISSTLFSFISPQKAGKHVSDTWGTSSGSTSSALIPTGSADSGSATALPVESVSSSSSSLAPPPVALSSSAPSGSVIGGLVALEEGRSKERKSYIDMRNQSVVKVMVETDTLPDNLKTLIQKSEDEATPSSSKSELSKRGSTTSPSSTSGSRKVSAPVASSQSSDDNTVSTTSTPTIENSVEEQKKDENKASGPEKEEKEKEKETTPTEPTPAQPAVAVEPTSTPSPVEPAAVLILDETSKAITPPSPSPSASSSSPSAPSSSSSSSSTSTPTSTPTPTTPNLSLSLSGTEKSGESLAPSSTTPAQPRSPRSPRGDPLPPKKKPRSQKCGRCLKKIKNPLDEIAALGKFWHPPCFVCNHCKGALTSRFANRNGQPYCTKCEEDLFSPKCKGCSKAIKFNFLEMNGAAWHVDCFVCSKCYSPLDDDFIESSEGKFYCINCDPEICGGCTKSMGRERVEALGKKWHPQCLNCTHCKKSLVQDGFVEHSEKAYCVSCMEEGHPLLPVDEEACLGCGTKVFADLAEFILVGTKKWHPLCLTCNSCYAPISAGRFENVESAESIFCLKCHCKGCKKPTLKTEPWVLIGTNQEQHKWHKECFSCYRCDGRLTTEFTEYEGGAYCDDCILSLKQEHMALRELMIVEHKKCSGCEEIIEGASVNLSGRSWHSNCIKCSTCSVVLKEDYFEHKNQLHCENCHQKLKAMETSAASSSSTAVRSTVEEPLPLCSACDQTIRAGEGPLVSAMSKKWHEKCFVCLECKIPVGDLYYEKEGKPYCGCQDRCGKCEKQVGPQRLLVLGKKFHFECFLCFGCEQPLGQSDFFEKNGLPHCEKCTT